jgi:hypothetical protein
MEWHAGPDNRVVDIEALVNTHRCVAPAGTGHSRTGEGA